MAGLIVLEPQTDPFDEGVVRASMGGIFSLQLARATHDELCEWASDRRCSIVGMSPRGDTSYTAIDIRSPVVIFLGEERRGLTERELSICHSTAGIPMRGHADSLNIGVAAGVVLFDLLRRRGERPRLRRRQHKTKASEAVRAG